MSDSRTAPLSDIPRAWPFEEARKLAEHVSTRGNASGGDDARPALLETGYGPSGLPHIGTFGEVARTSWVRQAYTALTGRPSRLLAFSDDMDALRKVPDNVPQREMLEKYIGQPLSRVPDPFGTHESFAAHNNARLCAFLDSFGFEYEFASSTAYYTSGRFDAALKRVLEVHEEILEVILPTLGAERRATYSPVLPLHPRTGEVMQVKMDAMDPVAGTVRWTDPASGEVFETPVTGGHAKMQWKADWAMRWYALGVDYEMSGKDLIDSVRLSGRICKILGGTPPAGLTYELFLDEQGQKISKSKGNGLSVEEWLRYAPPESLGQFMFNQPQRAKRLYFDVIPKTADEYLAHVDKALSLQADNPAGAELRANPAWFILRGRWGPRPQARCRLVCCSTSPAWPMQKRPKCCGALSAGMMRLSRPKRTPCWPPWCAMQWPITRTLSDRPKHSAHPANRSAALLSIWRTCCVATRQKPRTPRPCRMRCSRLASAMVSNPCVVGLAACTKCCWGRRKGHGSGVLSPCMGCVKPSP